MEKSIQKAVWIFLSVSLFGSSPKMAPLTPSGRHLSFSKNSGKSLRRKKDDVEILLKNPRFDKYWAAKEIDLALASDRSEGPPPIIAVIDTGVDLTHSHLKHQLWVNPGESGTDSKGKDKSNNGVDDDGDGSWLELCWE